MGGGRPATGRSTKPPKRNPHTGTRVTPSASGPGGRGPGSRGGGGRGGRGGKGPRGRKPWTFKRLVRIGLATGLVMVIVMALGFVFAYNMTDVPTANKAFKTQTTKIYYAGGKSELGTFVDQNRESISYSEMPQHVRDAAVAAEDRSFWSNSGLDPKGILRAAFSNAKGNSTQGASTITQQYVKILYLTSERTFKRKFKEAFVSLKLQRQQTKREILAGYLNTIYFGRSAYGIEAAAQTYFRKDAKDLTVPEGAFLAAVLNSPENMDPADGKQSEERVFARYRYVLDGMQKMGKLDAADAAEYEQALPRLPKEQKTQKYAFQRGFMLEMIHDELREIGFSDTDINGGGLRVTSTFTAKAMKAVKDGVLDEKPDGLKQLHAAAVSLDVGTGGVRGIYAGQNYLDSPFNWALKGGQPGSTFKPFALAAGIKDGFSLRSRFDGNSPYAYPDGTEVKNEGGGSGNDYGSKIDLVEATEESVNTAYADLTQAMDDGPQKIIDMAGSLGIPVDETELKPISGVALGSERIGMIDMANAYATIANKGMEHDWHVVDKVTRASDGKVIYQNKAEERRAVSADIASDVSYAMQEVVDNGTGTAAQAINRPAAGKTGTATNDKDQVSSAWFIGYTPQLVTAVMYVRGDGNDQLDGWLPEYFGGSYPARTWAAIMGAELEGLPVLEFPEPAFVESDDPPSSGYEPYTPPPAPKQQPKPQQPKKPKPSAPSPSAPPTTKPPSPSPSEPEPSNPSPSIPGSGGGGGGGTGGGGGGGNGGTGTGANRLDPARQE